jgi:hypothetical protein
LQCRTLTWLFVILSPSPAVTTLSDHEDPHP